MAVCPAPASAAAAADGVAAALLATVLQSVHMMAAQPACLDGTCLRHTAPLAAVWGSMAHRRLA